MYKSTIVNIMRNGEHNHDPQRDAERMQEELDQMSMRLARAKQRPEPYVGQMVHYVSYGTPNGEYEPEHRAAVVTAVEKVDVTPYDEAHYRGGRKFEIRASLSVLNPEGLFFNKNVRQDEDTKAGGTWHFIEDEGYPR